MNHNSLKMVKEILNSKERIIHLETLTQNVVGLAIAFIILTLWGLPFYESVALQTIFFVTSYIRGYCIRKLFRSLSKENWDEKRI